jgi:hypothetical protein
MKKDLYLLKWLLLTLVVMAFACRKPTDEIQPSQPISQVAIHDTTQGKALDTMSVPPAYPQAPLSGCAYDPNYGDTIIYPQPTTGGRDYIVSPINNPGPGRYFSWPAGMVIDSVTGAIDVTKSETGMRYAIAFVKHGTTDTCLSTLILGGGAYTDNVYVLGDNQSKAYPYFDANPSITSICTGNGPGGPDCSWDVTGSAASKKIIVDPHTGVIDLAKTLNGKGLLSPGAFGLLPLNGEAIRATIYYRLKDGSNMALQHMDVQFQYYDSKSQINPGLLGGIVNKLDNVLNNVLIDKTANPRPPLIIITRRN